MSVEKISSIILLGILVLDTPEDLHDLFGDAKDLRVLDFTFCQYLHSRSDPNDSEAIKLTGAMCELLDDTGIDFGGLWHTTSDHLLIRCRVEPQDARGSVWERSADGRKGKRGERLEIVLRRLRRSLTDGNGPSLLSLRPEDSMRMSDIYASIPSPPEPSLDPTASPSDFAVQARLADYCPPVGIKDTTVLYKYQIRSVAKMLRMETKPEPISDPLWTAVLDASSPRGRTFYLNMRTFEIRRFPPTYAGTRGGILNEDMGVGKTLMALSLVLATLDQPCLPPTNSPTLSTATTNHREHFYPFPRDRELRSQVKLLRTPAPRLRLPTLVELCVDVLARTTPRSVQLLQVDADRPLEHLVEQLQGCRPAYYERPEEKRVLRHRGAPLLPKRLLLANSTLIVIMSVNSFARQNQRDSVLQQARWKRLFLDEGHIAGLKNQFSNAMLLAQNLSIERRWMISGTPTKNLQQGGEVQVSSGIDGPSKTRTTAWSPREVDDVQSLGRIIANYLKVEPFASSTLFEDQITSKLRCRRSLGAVARLRSLLAAVMVKHIPGVIDAEISLPPYTQRTEVLDFHPMARKTYNALIAIIASNVYTSGATNLDYLLHPRNKAFFTQVVSNLELACFWFSSPQMHIAGCISQTKAYLVDDKRKFTAEARHQLEEAVRHLELALATPGWSQWMNNAVSIPFDSADLPMPIRIGWSDSPGDNRAIDPRSLTMLREANRRGDAMADLEAIGSANRVVKMELMDRDFGKAKEGWRWMGMGEPSDSLSAGASTSGSAARTKAGGRNRRARIIFDRQLEGAEDNARRGNAAHLPRPLPNTLYTTSRCAKINFVIRTVLSSDILDQFVVFGGKMELGHVSEALDLFEIKSCYAGPGISTAKREQALRDFLDPSVRVCLLDLKLGARGLNLVVANRIILLSPVRSRDTLAQAVRRIHRIGQTRPPMVQILVMRGTIEEDIANREVSRSGEGEDLHTRAAIKNPRFIEDTNDEDFPSDLHLNLVPLKERNPPPSTPPETASSSSAVASPQTPDGPGAVDYLVSIEGHEPGVTMLGSKRRAGEVELEESRLAKRGKAVAGFV